MKEFVLKADGDSRLPCTFRFQNPIHPILHMVLICIVCSLLLVFPPYFCLFSPNEKPNSNWERRIGFIEETTHCDNEMVIFTCVMKQIFASEWHGNNYKICTKQYEKGVKRKWIRQQITKIALDTFYDIQTFLSLWQCGKKKCMMKVSYARVNK